MGSFTRQFIHVRLAILPILVIGMLGIPHASFSAISNGQRPPSFHLVEKKPIVLTARKSRAKKAPVTVKKVRLGVYDTYTRVVFDLQRPVTFSQTRHSNPDQAIIDLENTILSKPSRAALIEKEFPSAVLISELKPSRVRIVIDLGRIQTYKLLPLNNPPRLVLDVFGQLAGAKKSPNRAAAPQANGAIPNTPIAQQPITSPIQTIMIDPGHGGKDPGAVGRNGAREKDITLKISLILRDLLKKELGKKVLMTRDRDRFVELEDRANVANDQDADLFVSVHVNSHPKRGVKGIEIYHFGEASDRRALEVAARENGTPIESTGVGWEYLVADLLTTKKVEDSLELAWTTKQAMVRHLKRRYKIRDHGVKTAPFYVLRFTSMPSILAEIGFISNPTEESLLRTNTYQRRVAQAIFRGIKAYISSLETTKR